VKRTVIGALACAMAASATAASPQLRVTLKGTPQVMFRPADGCDGHDVPDLAVRAFRDASGSIAMFALHYINRPLRGSSLDAMKVDCKVAYGSGFNPDPAAYDAQNWIAATWTRDGRTVEALVHHEYRAAQFKRCRLPTSGLACWYNTMLAARSDDGGVTFAKHNYPVIASAPFTQDIDQSRHRGFFNPSNIFGRGQHVYFFSAQTGWAGQPHGVCLFRSSDPGQLRSWRAWDGRDFTIRYDDPYRPGLKTPAACKPVEPFPAQVGAVVRHRPSGIYVAVVQAWKDQKYYPVSGFYYATSRDLLTWSDPRLLMATKSLYDDACGAGRLNSYPSILDPAARGRNFDDAGNEAYLYWSSMRVDGCAHTGDRNLMRQNMVIELLNSGRP
jgi:hypothetical protein